ncbi:MAG: hypothetical protein DLM71_03095 [Chloroflexi bacterium]|nr:MAG: hypothetical protein DLM71_03095 [Chloroflexota bacterium]
MGSGNDGVTELSEQGRQGDWYPFKVLWLGDATYKGIALVRGERIDALGSMHFSGRDQDQVPALRLTLNGWAFGGAAPGWREWNSYSWVQGPGCYAFRINGETFSRSVVIRVIKP